MHRAALAFLLVAAAAVASGGREQAVAAFDDDANDISYQKPLDGDLQYGDFDLRRFEVALDGDEVVFKVTMAAAFRQPAVTARTNATPVPLTNEIALQNIDIYIDTDAGARGFDACIPGRRVGFAGGRTWKVAVVLTPQPGPSENVTRDALGEAGKHVIFPRNLQTQGRSVMARVKVAALGGAPRRSWAYSVHVSGALWERSYTVVDRLANGKPEPDAFTMPVLTVPEAWAFGGPEGRPRVVDVLLPRGAKQDEVLASGKVPFVTLDPTPPPTPTPTPTPSPNHVVDLADKTVTLNGPTDGLVPMMLGAVLDDTGATVAHVVVVKVLAAGVVCEIVDGGERIQRGQRVLFVRR